MRLAKPRPTCLISRNQLNARQTSSLDSGVSNVPGNPELKQILCQEHKERCARQSPKPRLKEGQSVSGEHKYRWSSQTLWRSGSENIHLNPGQLGPRRRTRTSSWRIRRSSSTPFQDSLPDDGEAENDCWSISGNFIYHHRVGTQSQIVLNHDSCDLLCVSPLGVPHISCVFWFLARLLFVKICVAVRLKAQPREMHRHHGGINDVAFSLYAAQWPR